MPAYPLFVNSNVSSAFMPNLIQRSIHKRFIYLKDSLQFWNFPLVPMISNLSTGSPAYFNWLYELFFVSLTSHHHTISIILIL